MLFLQTKFVKCIKILYKIYFVIFTNFFFTLTTFDCTLKKMLTKSNYVKNDFFYFSTNSIWDRMKQKEKH